MNIGRELINNTIARKGHGNIHGFWVGHPTVEAKENYCKALGLAAHDENVHGMETVLHTDNCDKHEIAFQKAIGSDMVWVTPELAPDVWKHPEGKPLWDCFPNGRASLNEPGVFAECEDVAEVEAFDWPDPKYMDFSTVIENTKAAYESGMAVFGGMWCPFFHILCDFFGMENYFVKMYTDPEVVQAVTRHIVDFLVETNKILLKETAPYLSAGFFGNDLGTQISTLMSVEKFKEFILPSTQRIIETIKGENLPVCLHSCGSIDPFIPSLIDAGVDILHPLQALAANMDGKSLSAKYKGKLIFMGGVDTQDLLPHGTPEQVREEVLCLRDIFGDDYIVSPSHEALLPVVPFENVEAMSKAAKE